MIFSHVNPSFDATNKISSRLRLVGSFQDQGDPNTQYPIPHIPNDSMVNEAGDDLTQQKLAQNGRASEQVSSNRLVLLNLHVGGQSEPSTDQRMMQDGWCVDRKHFFIRFYPIANHDGWLAMYQPSKCNYLTSRYQPIVLPTYQPS